MTLHDLGCKEGAPAVTIAEPLAMKRIGIIIH